jgi:hypothetical protein
MCFGGLLALKQGKAKRKPMVCIRFVSDTVVFFNALFVFYNASTIL